MKILSIHLQGGDNLRIAVCDDEQLFLDLITSILIKEFKNHNIDCEIVPFKMCKEFLSSHRSNNFDIVFLDIVMPEINGFEAAKELRRISEKTCVIFITTESSMVYDSFEFQPFYFVPKGTKKFIEERLALVANKLAIRFFADKQISLSLPYGKTFLLTPMQIKYLRSSANYTEYILINRTVVRIRQKLDDAMKELSSSLFSRIHKSYAVNMKYIKTIDYSSYGLLLDDDTFLNISRKYKNDLEEAYCSYLRNFG